jgi:hypothetical protein
MKRLKKRKLLMLLLTGSVMSLTYCTKHDQILNPNAATPAAPTITNTDTLFVTKTPAGPTFVTGLGVSWDGTMDGQWDGCPKLKVNCVVPDLGNNTFTGFIGHNTMLTMRSMYDATNLYTLFEWDGVDKNVKSSPWYFNPINKRWAQEAGAPLYDINGAQTRLPFIQDELVIMFNIAHSCYTFNTQSCYAACHVDVPTMILDTTNGNINYVQHYGGAMHTNGPTEKLDCWRVRMLQPIYANQANDTYIDWGNGAINTNEVHNDPQLKITDGGISNKQTIKITGKTTKVSVPMWMNINATYNNGDGALLATDTANGTCVFITAVDTAGILSYAAARGGAVLGTLDPTSNTNYQQNGAGDGAKCIPGSIVALYSGSRADVTCNAFYTGSGWRVMMKRALKTNDSFEQDADFSTLADMPFGVGVMFNGADNEHAIHPGMILHFKK